MVVGEALADQAALVRPEDGGLAVPDLDPGHLGQPLERALDLGPQPRRRLRPRRLGQQRRQLLLLDLPVDERRGVLPLPVRHGPGQQGGEREGHAQGQDGDAEQGKGREAVGEQPPRTGAKPPPPRRHVWAMSTTMMRPRSPTRIRAEPTPWRSGEGPGYPGALLTPEAFGGV